MVVSIVCQQPDAACHGYKQYREHTCLLAVVGYEAAHHHLGVEELRRRGIGGDAQYSGYLLVRFILKHCKPEHFLIAGRELAYQRLYHLHIYDVVHLRGVLHLGYIADYGCNILIFKKLQRQVLHYGGEPIFHLVGIPEGGEA